MPTKRKKDDLPKTASELRRLIAKKGYKWTVDPRLRDSDLIPRYARGGQVRARGKVSAVEVKNVSEYLADQPPPANLFLRDRWVELKLLTRERRGTLTGTPMMGPAPAIKKSAKRPKGKRK
jgi:hypothetical protein